MSAKRIEIPLPPGLLSRVAKNLWRSHSLHGEAVGVDQPENMRIGFKCPCGEEVWVKYSELYEKRFGAIDPMGI